MARLTGPLMSIDASGSIAGALTFAKWKGRNYVRQLVTPANPRSPAQTAFRAMFGFLSREWAGLNSVKAGAQATWEELAEAGNYSPFNAYMRWNQDRWSRFLAPEVEPVGGDELGTTDALTSATAGVKSVRLLITGANETENWGNIIFRSTGSQPTGLQTEVIAVLPHTNDGTMDFNDLGLTPGVAYYYRMRTFSYDGNMMAITAAVNATPT